MKAIFAGLWLGACLAVSPPVSAQEADAPRPAIVQDYEPDPAIWLVRDEDTLLYLFGTVHVLPEGFRWRSARLDGIVEEATELVVESTDEDTSDAPEIARIFGSMTKRTPVSERLSPENAIKWLSLGESTGMGADYFDRMPPLLALFGMGLVMGAEQTGAEQEHGVETVLEAAFRKADKPIGSIENAGEVLGSLLDVDEGLLIKELDRSLSQWNGKDMGTMLAGDAADAGAPGDPLESEHSWARGEEVDIREEFTGKGTLGTIVGKRLLDNRNRAWAGWIEARLAEPGTVLVAVGAAHLAGTNSVQDMLAARGLTAERLN
jgi:uncharacterized protein YbaP (TraB family)